MTRHSQTALRSTRAEKLLVEGNASYLTGDISAATAKYTEILLHRPEHFDALCMLGLIAFQQREYEDSVNFLTRASQLKKKDDILYFLGISLQQLGQLKEAIAAYRRVLKLKPEHADANNMLGTALHALGKHDQAALHYNRAIVFSPRHAEAHCNLGSVRFAQGRLEEALESFEVAIACNPHLVDAYNKAGVTLQALGKLDKALAYFKQSLSIKPDSAISFLHYIECKKITKDDSVLLEKLEQLSLRSDLPHESMSNVLFALGKAYDNLGLYEKAFSSFKKANRLENAKYKVDHQRIEVEITTLIETFSKEFFVKRSSFGDPSIDEPILIIGMPRSGTTLVEQILSSHSAVVGAGELDFWIKQKDKISPLHITQKDSRSIAFEYMAYLRTLFPKDRRIVDKMPQNFITLGLIHLCLPSTRIIHCKRDPLDTCLSIYFQKFDTPHPCAYDLEEIAFLYEQYMRIMRHWKCVLSDHILEVSYEDLVIQQEITTRKILAFCNLTWEEQCLDFQTNNRIVLSASNWQVRQPLYTSSIGRWKNYRQFLGPLLRLKNAS